MEILEFGNPNNEKIILIHGFESPYQIWEDYIEYFKKDYCVIVPILTGHNVNENEDFESFDKCIKEFESFFIPKYGVKAHAVYGMSMGGVFASILWQNQNIKIDKLIMESSPLLGFGSLMRKILINQYLKITHKAQSRDRKTVRQAINTMVTEDKLDIFMELLDHISDVTIINYIKEIGIHKLPRNITTPETEIYYLYGSKMSEFIFRGVAKYIKKNYQNAKIICLKGKGHCEDALLNTEKHIKVICEIINN